jgi:hypothetical protein
MPNSLVHRTDKLLYGKSVRVYFNATYSGCGMCVDALPTQLDEIEFSALLVIQSFRPDAFFRLEQQLCGDRRTSKSSL